MIEQEEKKNMRHCFTNTEGFKIDLKFTARFQLEVIFNYLSSARAYHWLKTTLSVCNKVTAILELLLEKIAHTQVKIIQR